MNVAVNTSPPHKKLPLILMAGPTASAKSALALALSRLLPITIINADASQVYRDLRVLSARPSIAEERDTPHRLFGHVDGASSYSAAQWAADARAAITKVRQSWRMPVLVGGTGLYIRTLLDGIAPVPEIDPAIRAAVRALRVEEAYASLLHEDAVAATKLSPNDTSRVARALEVVRSTGKPISAWQAERTGAIGDSVRLIPLILLPPREWLFKRCDARFEAMLEQGARQEVVSLLARGLDPALPVMRAIGVREIAGILADPDRANEQIEAARVATRQYAKRQYTWFRNQLPTDWMRLERPLDKASLDELAVSLRDHVIRDWSDTAIPG
jgi:tRNA dimethylallyltransferase